MGGMLSNKTPWDLVAPGYAEITMKLFHAYTLAALEFVGIDKRHDIVDIACGPGTLALAASPLANTIHALDFSAPMLDILDRTIEEQGINNIMTHYGDGQQLPYGDDSFDAAFSMFGLMFFPDRAKGYAEVLRVLKPGSKAVISSWAPLSHSPAMHAVFGALRAIKPDMPEPQEEVESLENPDFFGDEMRRAGFKNVDVKPVVGEVKINSLETYWDDMVKGSAPLVMLKQSMTDEQWQASTQIALTYLRETVASKSSLTAKAWLAVGTK
ncbi:MAG: methyltransferase domain-containing protein [Gammaproteobacteria bacterium]|nr:methyltransferase domain-containing protein [Gammaproteobacteria bacterium]